MKDVVAEANALASGWGGIIFQSANEIVVNRLTKKKIEEKRATLQQEKTAWEAQRERSRAELEGELDLTKQVEQKAVEQTSTSESTPEKAKPLPPTGSSDEDAVMVDTPAGEVPPVSASAGANLVSSGGGKGKKKKGKK